MSEPAAAVDSPMIRITVEVPLALAEVLTSNGWCGPLTAEVSRVAMELLETLGVPGRSAVVLEGRDGVEGPFQIRVEDSLCRCDTNFFNALHSLFLRRLPPPGANVVQMNEWLFGLTQGSAAPESAKGRQLIEFVATACGEVLRRKPSRLLGEAQAEAYRERLLLHWQAALPVAALRPWMAEALDFGLTLADVPRIAAALQEGLRQQHDPHELAEDLIATLQPEEIEVRLAPGYLRTLTEDDALAGEEMPFAMMREGLFFELGLTLTKFRFVTDAQLAPCCFAFKLNHRVTLPRQGLTSAERFANDTMERLRSLGLQALTTAANPINGAPISVLSTAEAEDAAQVGVTSWTPLGYLILCLSSELRRYAAALLSRGAVDHAVEQLGHDLPVLIVAARERLSLSRLCRVLRELLAEEVSIRHLSRILEAILDCDYVLADESLKIVFDDRLAFRSEPPAGWKSDPVLLAASVRRVLKHYLGYKCTRGQATLAVYLLAPELETKLAAQSSGTLLSELEADRILRAMQSEIDPLQASEPPTILTTTEARRPFRQLIAPVYPWLPVVAYQELPPEMNIQQLGRISLG